MLVINRKTKTFIAVFLLLGLAFIMEGCCKEKQNQIVFHYKNVSLYKGGEFTLLANRVINDAPFEGDYLWESSDSTIVSVNDGIVHANSEGTATISATLNGVTGTCLITVSEGNDFTFPAPIVLKVGETKDVVFSSRGGVFTPIAFSMENDGYFASYDLSNFEPLFNNDIYQGSPINPLFAPEYKYEGIELSGKHEGTTNFHIYFIEIGFDKLIPVTVLP